MPGTNTLGTEVTSVSRPCIWILIDDEELALPYSEFPWFKAATIQQIMNVLQPTSGHLYWPDLDVDLSVESIRYREVSAKGKEFPFDHQDLHLQKNRELERSADVALTA
jgi:hypothetical protein